MPQLDFAINVQPINLLAAKMVRTKANLDCVDAWIKNLEAYKAAVVPFCEVMTEIGKTPAPYIKSWSYISDEEQYRALALDQESYIVPYAGGNCATQILSVNGSCTTGSWRGIVDQIDTEITKLKTLRDAMAPLVEEYEAKIAAIPVG